MPKWKFKPDELDAFRGTGYELIPLHTPDALDRKGRSVGKAPHKGWRKDRPLDFDEALDHMEDSNVGVRLRACDLVVDVDPRNFEEGDDPISRLERDLGISFSGYPTVVTGSGGLHIYMLKPEHEQLRDTLEAYQGVEFKALGRQVVSPGSVHPDTHEPYKWDELSATLDEIKDAPKSLIEIARRPGRTVSVDAGKYSAEQLGEMLDGLDPTQYQDHTAWLELMMACHHATAGEGRDEFLEWSTSDPQYSKDAWLIGRRWDSLHADDSSGGNRRVTERTLFKALHKADNSNLIPRDTAQDDFGEPIDTTADNYDEFDDTGDDDRDLQEVIDTLPDGDPGFGPMEAMNAKGYAAVNENGLFRIYRKKMDYTWPTGPREFWEVQKKGDFLDILSNVRIQKTVGDKQTVVPLAGEWLKWGKRTSYDGVAFDPAHQIPDHAGVLNLWTDWAFEPKKGAWSKLDQLVREGLADGNEEVYNYMLDWAAFMIQHPEKQAEVALVVRGAKGTGKGTFFRALANLSGRHGMHVSHQHHFTNHFNSHLRDCVFLFVDEAMWAGDKKAEGELKRLITEPTIMFEGKGKDAIMGRNYLHVAMASNEDWVIPASMEDERRFMVTEASDKFRGDKKFFDALYAELDDGGLQALLFDLKTRDISDFHPRGNIPATKALAEQKLQSLDNFDSWWYECLCSGDPTDENGPVDGEWDVDPLGYDEYKDYILVPVEDVKASLETYLRKAGDRYFGRKSMDRMIGMRLQKRLPSLEKVRIRPPSHRGDLHTFSDGRCYAYVIPLLHECRAHFESDMGQQLEWAPLETDDEYIDLDKNVRDFD